MQLGEMIANALAATLLLACVVAIVFFLFREATLSVSARSNGHPGHDRFHADGFAETGAERIPTYLKHSIPGLCSRGGGCSTHKAQERCRFCRDLVEFSFL